MLGKKNVVSQKISNYNIGIIGESGIGKSTLMASVCHKLFGDDGYILLNVGREDGISAIDGVIYENVPDFKTYKSIAREIITNKKDYPNLKILVIDTLDEMIGLAQEVTIQRWNSENMGRKGFEPVKSIAAAWGGFGRGEARARQEILDIVWALKNVGVNTWYVGHTRVKDMIDPISSLTYNTLSTNMAQKDFDDFKNKMHVVGVACIDRTIKTEGTGRKNIVTHKEVTVNRVKSESRVIKFRDDNYTVDSKSRFKDIVDEIPLDADAFIKAISDAIAGSKSVSGKDGEDVTLNDSKPVEELVERADADLGLDMNEPEEDLSNDIFATEEKEYPENLRDVVKVGIKSAEKDVKNEIKKYLSDNGVTFSGASDEIVRGCYDILTR